MKRAVFSLKRGALALASLAASSLFLSSPGDSQTRSSVHPYLEIQQVLTADFNGGDVLTYTGVGGGIEASIESRRVTATISYDYQRRIAWSGHLRDHDVHTGLAAAHVEAIPGVLSFDAGAIATRGHADIATPAVPLRTSDDPRIADVYSAYAGPTLNTRVGPVSVGAAYRLGYVYVDDHDVTYASPQPGAPRVERYRSSTVQNATASVGMAPGQGLPFGWTVGAGYVREDMKRFDSKFEGKYVRGDIVVPVGASLALTAGAGYESDKSSQQDILRDASGLPVIGPNGEAYADPSKPRLLTYDNSGLIWDAGVIWRPNRRTELQARVGHRYGGMTYTGSFEHHFNGNYVLSAAVFDDVSSFGRLMVADLAGVPRAFQLPRSGLGGLGGLGSCVFGTKGGVCFDDALQSVANFNFRNRGANLHFSGERGVWSFGLGATYVNRRYFAPPGNDFVLHGVTDQSFTLDGRIGRRLTRRSGIDFDAFAGWFDSGRPGVGSGTSGGISASYYRTIFGDHIQATAQAGLYTAHGQNYDRTYGTVLFGLRYGF